MNMILLSNEKSFKQKFNERRRISFRKVFLARYFWRKQIQLWKQMQKIRPYLYTHAVESKYIS